MKTSKLTESQYAALKLAASRKSGLVSCGHRFPTPQSTLLSLHRKGYVVHVGTAGPYYDRQSQYRITDAGRIVLQEENESPVRKKKYEVVVGTIGSVYRGTNREEAEDVFNSYVEASKLRRGRAGGEDVGLFEDDEIVAEHAGVPRRPA